MTKKPQTSHQKGVVTVEDYQGRLRLRWTYAGKRYCLALSLPNSKVNLKAAQQKAIGIELDIASGNFDPTLVKYKPSNQKTSPEIRISAIDLFQKFIEYKASSLYSRSLEKYYTVLRDINKFFDTKTASLITEKDVEKFAQYLGSKLSSLTLKERLTLVKACWQWGIKQNLVKDNPWFEVPNKVKVPPKPMSKPFSKKEIAAILSAFENHSHYKCQSVFPILGAVY